MKDEMIACTYVDKDGKMCPDQIKNHKTSIRAHMRTKHGIDPNEAEDAAKAKADAAPIVKVDKSGGSKDGIVMSHNLRAIERQKQLLDEVQAMAPDGTMGLTSQPNELKTWEQHARKTGLVDPEESIYWADSTKLDLEAMNGREIVMLHDAPLRYGDVTMTKMPKVITEAKQKAFMNSVKKRYSQFIQEGEQEAAGKGASKPKSSE